MKIFWKSNENSFHWTEKVVSKYWENLVTRHRIKMKGRKVSKQSNKKIICHHCHQTYVLHVPPSQIFKVRSWVKKKNLLGFHAIRCKLQLAPRLQFIMRNLYHFLINKFTVCYIIKQNVKRDFNKFELADPKLKESTERTPSEQNERC